MTTTSSGQITEPLVDAKDQARLTELRSEFAQALLSFQKETAVLAWRATALIIVVLGIGVAIILSALPGG